VCCRSKEFHSPLYGTDYESLLNLGVVRDRDDFDSWCDVVACVNHHDCNRAGGRCRKATNAEGDKVCRYRRQPPWYLSPPGNQGAWFTPITVPYPEEVYSLLMDMGLARRERDKWFEPEHWVLNECLAAGKWNYRSDSDEFFLASIPIVSAILRPSTNFECCDVRFQTSYLVKYLSSKEEHQLTSVSGTKDINEVVVTTEEHAHEKITNCARTLQQKEKKIPILVARLASPNEFGSFLGFLTQCTQLNSFMYLRYQLKTELLFCGTINSAKNLSIVMTVR